ncbi:hypothetical protein JDW15_07940 [Aerococcaceae bacterium zg-ZJ1578]|uniref:hypothetical protein n=1 Tax=Aerococcaceae bacterium zg-252 TaxID=2796928 RepID=UPI001A265182|nr:hypothetical protein [Aerococcaceae bacterium zg-1578]
MFEQLFLEKYTSKDVGSIEDVLERLNQQIQSSIEVVEFNEMEEILFYQEKDLQEFIMTLFSQGIHSSETQAFIKKNQVLLSGVVSFLAQQYEVIPLCLLLMLMLVSECDKEQVREGLLFIQLQRRDEGRYGFLNPFKVDMSQIKNNDIENFLEKTTYYILLTLAVAEKRGVL